ncbi:MAG: polysaccharide export protein, partial [Candidatus Acidoferrum typicum]|nr:polysaccharide export protein [Candidatus Acidoferrum typicum]
MRSRNIERTAGFGWAARQVAALLLTVTLAAPAAQSQQQSRQGAAQQSGSETPARVSVRPPDIISDNLDRVAASADQILEVLNKEPGLMVELKRLLAQDAGASGQILEESDLTDVSVAERLRSELRARVLATRLLQRYGFLVPRLNPDSDLEAERKLVLQERAQILARAAERRDTLSDSSPAAQNAACDPRRFSECALPSTLPLDRESLPVGPIVPGRVPRSSTPVQQAGDSPQNEMFRPDGTSVLPNQRSEYPASSGSTETVLASMRAGTNPQLNATPNMPGYGNRDSLSVPLTGQPDLESFSISQPEQPAVESRAPRTGRSFEPYSAERNAAPASAVAAESVRMVRRPNPYADVPSLYDLYVQAGATNRPLERFGLDVFRKGEANPAYLPMDLPVGPNYVVGPGDSLSIDLWGGVSQRLVRTVDREGRVSLPEAGPILVSGRTLGDVQQEVQRVLRTQFRDVSADVSLQRLRTVRVYVVGDVSSPGAYDVSSLSTPLNALFAAGGVTQQGSLRRLQHYRGKQLIEEVDAYDLLLRGIRGDLARLENGDSLLVPPLGSVVKVDGMVRRPALYELRSEKTLEDALDLAGGILPAAALRHIEVQRLVAHEKRTMLSVEIGETSDPEAVRAQLRGLAVQDGDEIHIFPIAPYNSASIYLQGHVLRPGRYSYKPAMKLTDLVTSYADLLPEPSVRYAEIIRLHTPDYHPVVETFDLATAFEHPEKAPKLEPLDTVRIFGRFDFEPDPEVLVTGEVRAPGRYRTSGQQHLRDVIFQAGGATPDAWLDSAQLFRRQPDGITRVFSINLSDALAGDPLNNVLVQPRDRILVHRQPEQVSPANVYVRGDVARPGRYPLAANMRVADLVQSAGGLLRSANPDAGDLSHYAISNNSSGERMPSGHQDLNLAAALAGRDDQNLPLHDGDVLTVPQQAGWNDIGATVTLRGEVRKPGVYGIRPGERLSSLVKRAGGLLPTAYPRAAMFERAEVRELQQKSRQELIQRLEQESTVVKTSASTTGAEEAALQQAAIQQRQRALDALRKAPVSGRLVIHLRPDRKDFAGSPDDIELRAGDSLTVPKQPGGVLVIGQVYNSNALTYTPGRNAGWYLSRAGGPTQLANKGGIFIIRSDGSVTGGNQGGFWSGSVLSSALGPGDTIVVPEKPVL